MSIIPQSLVVQVLTVFKSREKRVIDSGKETDERRLIKKK